MRTRRPAAEDRPARIPRTPDGGAWACIAQVQCHWTTPSAANTVVVTLYRTCSSMCSDSTKFSSLTLVNSDALFSSSPRMLPSILIQQCVHGRQQQRLLRR
ncbi:hypothetical protein [Xanthomonas fragariae]|uniref:hypothetical protein n=1 Tax=Xanthomonas fragariae TaxID=48664 RepID=UPI0011AB58DC|nr:hypothetical protein [Xanthomonas fragariae]MBL9196212.1 hypothetical protein [Xanthomonas fragariae]MEA5175212.1 hypothetical protein [Xanthomonas fragariae]WIY71496.1 hypothetical protein OW158_13445 [Xanthomonas fragariae]